MNLSQFIVIGRYIPKDSYIHKLDSRSKLLFAFLNILFIFTVNNILGYIILFTLVITGMVISKIPFTFYIKGLYPIMWIILFTTIIHLTMTTGGNILFQWNIIIIYSYGLQQALFVAVRLVLLVIIASILTLTTSPIDITVGLERLLNPLKFLRVPVHEIALMMSISLRFIPTLLEETEKIIKAQKARGGNFESGPIKKRMANLIAIIIPLFIGSIKRAEELAIAMEARGYHGGKNRTRLKVSDFTWRDLLLLILLCILLIVMIYVRG